MFNALKFIRQLLKLSGIYKTFMYKIFLKKDASLNFDSILNKIKEAKNELNKLSYEDLRLLNADLESQIRNEIGNKLSIGLIGVLIGAILSKARDVDNIVIIIFLVVMVVFIFIIGVYMILYQHRLVFIREIVNICLEEKEAVRTRRTRTLYGYSRRKI